MTLLHFMSHLDEYIRHDKASIWVFKGKEYYSIFFYYLFLLIKKNYVVRNIEFVEWKSQLIVQAQTTFLGERVIYWCKDSAVLSEKEFKEFLHYIQHYKGPHIIGFFIADAVDLTFSPLVIELEEVTSEKYTELISYYNAESLSPSFVEEFFSLYPSCSLDRAFIIMGYHQLIGKKHHDFCNQWLGRIIVKKSSLFELGGMLLGLKQKVWTEWYEQKKNYPEEFWIAFWLELIWQSLLFVTLAHHTSLVEAKKNTFRLPFSFIQKDWKIHTTHTLKHAYNFLYELDYRLKNGLADLGAFDIFIHKFINRQF